MRQLQKIRQYQRLSQHYGAEPTLTTIAEVAEVALCSERHARTLLRQLAQSGWLLWDAQPGRGHRATLHGKASTSELSAPLMHACLEKGDYQSALQLADGDPASLHHIITPFLGGKWLKHQPTLRIPWYRPLTSLHPALQRRRAEQHIICAVHAGLTRYAPGQTQPAPDLAHHWDISDDTLCWRFYLRSGAHWHNGQAISDSDILSALQQALADPTRNTGLRHISQVTLSAPSVCKSPSTPRMHFWHIVLRITLAASLTHNCRISGRVPLPSPTIIHTICVWSGNPGTLPRTRSCMPLNSGELAPGRPPPPG